MTPLESQLLESPVIGAPEIGREERSVPALCVDLDGTLVKSNTLVDSLLVLARKRPMDILRLPGWLAKGRVVFKQRVSAAVQLDVEHLPYNQLLLEYLRKQHGAGRPLYLATAADSVLADHVAGFLGIFDEVLASDGVTNLSGENKLEAFRRRFPQGFCYIGNASPDALLLAASQTPMVANPHLSLRRLMRRSGTVSTASFIDRAPLFKSWLRAVRLHQWAKNTLIFVPLLLAHQWNAATITGAVVAFFSFGMCASATYIINDLLDLETDRRHPRSVGD